MLDFKPKIFDFVINIFQKDKNKEIDIINTKRNFLISIIESDDLIPLYTQLADYLRYIWCKK